MQKKKETKNINNKKNIIIFWIITSIIVVSITGITLARYIIETNSEKKLIEAQDFYFSSNYLTLESDNIYTISDYADGDEIIIEVYNYEDELRYTTTDVVYEVISDKLLAEDIIQTEFVGTDLKTSEVKVKVKKEYFVDGIFSFTLTAKSKSPYEEMLSATFNVYQAALAEDAYMEVIDNLNSYTVAVTVTTEGKEGEIMINYPDTLAVDYGDERITEATQTYLKFNAQKNSVYEFTLFKENLDDIYALDPNNSFQIVAEVVGKERLPLDAMIGLGDDQTLRDHDSWGSYDSNDSAALEYITDENGNVGYVSKDNSSVSKLVPADQPVNEQYSINVTIRGDWADNPPGVNNWGGTICAMSPAIDRYINWMAVAGNDLKIYSYDYMSYTNVQYTLIDISEYNNKYLNIIITAEKGKTTKVYLNGTLASEFPSGNIAEQANPELSIGDLRGERGLHFKGTIYNFALYNKALNEDEVKAVWNYYNGKMNIE